MSDQKPDTSRYYLHVRNCWQMLAMEFPSLERSVALGDGRPPARAEGALARCKDAISALGELTKYMSPEEEGPVHGARLGDAGHIVGRQLTAAIELERTASETSSEDVVLGRGRIRNIVTILRESVAALQTFAEAAERDAKATTPPAEPGWTGGEVIDSAPAIRCWPAVGVVFAGPEGPVLSIDPQDGGNVALVHIGDVAEYKRSSDFALLMLKHKEVMREVEKAKALDAHAAASDHDRSAIYRTLQDALRYEDDSMPAGQLRSLEVAGGDPATLENLGIDPTLLRQQVPLRPGDQPYEWHGTSQAAPGFRWEYDSELRTRHEIARTASHTPTKLEPHEIEPGSIWDGMPEVNATPEEIAGAMAQELENDAAEDAADDGDLADPNEEPATPYGSGNPWPHPSQYVSEGGNYDPDAENRLDSDLSEDAADSHACDDQDGGE